MNEKLNINGRDVWVIVESRKAGGESSHSIPTEYFIAFYSLHEPGVYNSVHEPGKAPGIMFTDESNEALLFLSPVAAVEYAVETLPKLLDRVPA
ncbi:hypothetical protein HNQ91_005743 [Filimonas zeae]|uniref:Uncharacterized protein n=1 Tax=Filimonas zeae TaxID=1737353 RepID=A0A917MZ87_9BACT|nr:hypothetical protein [Filimonas zeae]MDR6342658.1 hypothetical protein [Filimonas zeae]GGH82193.1 hypothetical protein GCM10011379_55710 [Filimonas zeae]